MTLWVQCLLCVLRGVVSADVEPMSQEGGVTNASQARLAWILKDAEVCVEFVCILATVNCKSVIQM